MAQLLILRQQRAQLFDLPFNRASRAAHKTEQRTDRAKSDATDDGPALALGTVNIALKIVGALVEFRDGDNSIRVLITDRRVDFEQRHPLRTLSLVLFLVEAIEFSGNFSAPGLLKFVRGRKAFADQARIGRVNDGSAITPDFERRDAAAERRLGNQSAKLEALIGGRSSWSARLCTSGAMTLSKYSAVASAVFWVTLRSMRFAIQAPVTVMPARNIAVLMIRNCRVRDKPNQVFDSRAGKSRARMARPGEFKIMVARYHYRATTAL